LPRHQLLDQLEPAFLDRAERTAGVSHRLIASRDDKYSPFDDSEALAKLLGAKLIDAGHIDSESGHGLWPELMREATFLKKL
jgi:predicted alpha/beta hydrolase family esterase